MITAWILVLHIMTSNGHDALSAVAPFTTQSECRSHAAQLFDGWNTMMDDDENHYHRLDSIMHYVEIHEGEWVASWSCVPSIDRYLGLNNIPSSFQQDADKELIPQ